MSFGWNFNNMFSKQPILLASKSPRRLELLQSVGFNVDQLKISVDETLNATISTKRGIQEISQRKYAEAKQNYSHKKGILITADTLVEVEGEVLGKPKSINQARQMLETLAGKFHTVYTAVSMGNINDDFQIDFVEKTKVYLDHVDPVFTEWYLKQHPPLDKAGAYGIQDPMGMAAVGNISGCYYNVMGLPVSRIIQFLNEV